MVGLTDSNAAFMGQCVIAVTGMPVALSAAGFNLQNGMIIKAKSTNNAEGGFVGPDNTVTMTNDGTGNGYSLLPGEAISFGVSRARPLSDLYVNGTAGDIFYYAGN